MIIMMMTVGPSANSKIRFSNESGRFGQGREKRVNRVNRVNDDV